MRRIQDRASDHVNDERVQGIDAGRPNQPSWSPIALYPVAIMDNSADQIDGTVYSVGGLPSIANAYAYDPTDDTWSAIANMPAPREKAGVGGIGGKLYVAGGWSPGGVPVACHRRLRPWRRHLEDAWRRTRRRGQHPARRSSTTCCISSAVARTGPALRRTASSAMTRQVTAGRRSLRTRTPPPGCRAEGSTARCTAPAALLAARPSQRRVRLRPGRQLVVADRGDALQPVGLGVLRCQRVVDDQQRPDR